jgi:hypothetical protein
VIPKSYAFMNMMAAVKSVVNLAKRISFASNVPYYARVDFVEVPSCSLWSSQSIDEDGSISGIPNAMIIPEILTVEEASVLDPILFRGFSDYAGENFIWDKQYNLPPAGDSGSCSNFGNATHKSRTWICNQRVGLLLIYTNDALQSSSGHILVNYTRSDGYKVSDKLRDGASAVFHTSVYLNKTSISYGMETPRPVPSIFFRLMDVIPGDWTIYRVDSVTLASRYILYTDNPPVQLFPMNSLNAFYQNRASCVYYNQSTNSALIKIVAGKYSYYTFFGTYRSNFKYNGFAQMQVIR